MSSKDALKNFADKLGQKMKLTVFKEKTKEAFMKERKTVDQYFEQRMSFVDQLEKKVQRQYKNVE